MTKENVSDVYLYNYLIYTVRKKNECISVFEENNFFSLGRGEVTVFIFWNLPEGVKL